MATEHRISLTLIVKECLFPLSEDELLRI